jgi:hypothetical protein
MTIGGVFVMIDSRLLGSGMVCFLSSSSDLTHLTRFMEVDIDKIYEQESPKAWPLQGPSQQKSFLPPKPK